MNVISGLILFLSQGLKAESYNFHLYIFFNDLYIFVIEKALITNSKYLIMYDTIIYRGCDKYGHHSC